MTRRVALCGVHVGLVEQLDDAVRIAVAPIANGIEGFPCNARKRPSPRSFGSVGRQLRRKGELLFRKLLATFREVAIVVVLLRLISLRWQYVGITKGVLRHDQGR